MGRLCLICTHVDAEKIDAAIIEGKGSFRKISQHFKISPYSLYRHRKNHLPAKLVKAKKVQEVIQADNNIDRLLVLQKEVQKILEAAKEARTWHICLEAVREAARLIELSSKISGELRPEFSVILSPQFITIQTAIIEALSPFPEARSRVVEALKRVERYGE